MKKNRINYQISSIICYSLLLLLILVSCKKATNNNRKDQIKKPNVVVILVDDLGWKDLGYTGSTFYETPNIDALSKKSIQFPNAYSSSPICSPARASILTGKHPSSLNITDWIPGDDPKNRAFLGPQDYDYLPLEEYTLAEALKANNYTTFFAGKWHLGSANFTPENQGFDINIAGGHFGQPPGGYYAPYKNDKIKDGPNGEYLTDRLTLEAINFIDSNSKKPFFLYLSYYTVHTPIQANKKYIKKFKDKLATIPEHSIKKATLKNAITRLDQYHPEYASMVYAMDENVGKLIAKLKAKGIYDNTIIVFTSDNGGLSTLEKHTPQSSPTAPTAVAPLKAGKGWLYEGGLKVPFLIKPAHFNQEAKIIETPILGSDIFPTVLALTNTKNKPNNTVYGKDISPLFQGKPIDRETLFWHYPHYHGSGWTPGSSIRKGNWKLIEFYTENTFELYNLSTDPYETNNIVSDFPETANALKEELSILKKETHSKEPIANPNFKGVVK